MKIEDPGIWTHIAKFVDIFNHTTHVRIANESDALLHHRHAEHEQSALHGVPHHGPTLASNARSPHRMGCVRSVDVGMGKDAYAPAMRGRARGGAHTIARNARPARTSAGHERHEPHPRLRPLRLLAVHLAELQLRHVPVRPRVRLRRLRLPERLRLRRLS